MFAEDRIDFKDCCVWNVHPEVTETFLEQITPISREWALIDEKHDVEVYGVWHSLGRFLHHDEESIEVASEWYQNTLSETRRIYSGDIAAVGSDLEFNYIGYDYIFLGYCGVPPGTSLEEQSHA